MTTTPRPLRRAARRRRLDTTASLTAQINAAQRAAEALLPAHRRMHDDAASAVFVTQPGLRLLLGHRWLARGALAAVDRAWPGLHSHIILRARYAEAARTAAIEQGIDQLVLLGAGFDSAALRPAAVPLDVFEVDAPATQRVKRELLQRRGIGSTHRMHWVACDFETDDFTERLIAHGFRIDRPCLVVWLGVSFYLSAPAFAATVDRLNGLCAPGSRLILDYGDPGIVDGSSRWVGARRVARLVARRGEPYRLGFTSEQVAAQLAGRGFEVVDQLGVPGLIARFTTPNPAWSRDDDWLGILTAERVPAE
ncbi:hypothetical protein BHQ15_00595 [Mycolicibacillus koreensis]|nr:hypothetical protein BHQ15_00595 [Mycolicibacillus koreensis]